jgi:hypothetical protein
LPFFNGDSDDGAPESETRQLIKQTSSKLGRLPVPTTTTRMTTTLHLRLLHFSNGSVDLYLAGEIVARLRHCSVKVICWQWQSWQLVRTISALSATGSQGIASLEGVFFVLGVRRQVHHFEVLSMLEVDYNKWRHVSIGGRTLDSPAYLSPCGTWRHASPGSSLSGRR